MKLTKNIKNTWGGEMILPNVSHCIDQNDVHYNPWVQKITQINGYNVPFITGNITTFFDNPFTITMLGTVNANNPIISIHYPQYDEDYNILGPGELKETATATSEDGINWNCNFSSTISKTTDWVITITFNIDNEDVTYQTYYMWDGK